MMESIAHVEWIRRNVFDVGGSSISSERIGKHLKRWRGEGVENKNVCNVEGLQYWWSRGDLYELEMYKLVRQLEASRVS